MARSGIRTEADTILRRYLERPTRAALARVVTRFQSEVWTVALRVSGNAADAADLCQELFLGLLLRPPSPDSVRSARGYLIARLSSLARARRRSTERRTSRERQAFAPLLQESDSTSEDLDHLRAAVDELPEPQRAVVVLRYFGGLSNREIASALDRSERSVERDLQQARALLRERLRGRLDACLSAIALMRSGPPPRLSGELQRVVSLGQALAPLQFAAVTGGLVMKKVIAGAAVLSLLCGVAALWSTREPGDSQRSVASPARSQLLSAGEESLEHDRTDGPRGFAANRAPGSDDVIPDPDVPANAIRILLRAGRRDDPVVRHESQLLLYDTGVEFRPMHFGIGDGYLVGEIRGNGSEFTFEDLVPGRYYAVRASVASFADAFLQNLLVASSPYALELGPECTLHGVVLDENGGVVPGATVTVRQFKYAPGHEPSTWFGTRPYEYQTAPVSRSRPFDLTARTGLSDGDGRFDFHGLRPGKYQLQAAAAGYAVSSVHLDVGRGPNERDLTLGSETFVLRGKVLDGNRPVSDVFIQWSFVTEHIMPIDSDTTTDAAGAFEVQGVPRARWEETSVALLGLHFSKQGYPYAEEKLSLSREELANGTKEIVVELSRSWLRGRVAVNGEPVAHGVVAIGQDASWGTRIAPAPTDPDGFFELPIPRPGSCPANLLLRVEHATGSQFFQVSTLHPRYWDGTPLDVGFVDLPRRYPVTLGFVSEDGLPIREGRVTIRRNRPDLVYWVEKGSWLTSDQRGSPGGRDFIWALGQTNGDGTMTASLSPGRYEISCEDASEHLLVEVVDFDPTIEELRFEVPLCEPLEITVLERGAHGEEKPVPGGTVCVLELATAGLRRGFISKAKSNGRVAFENAPYGFYFVKGAIGYQVPDESSAFFTFERGEGPYRVLVDRVEERPN